MFKQHVTVEQMEQARIVGSLNRWIHFYDEEVAEKYAPTIQQSLIHMDDSQMYKIYAEYLTIGKMIEILDIELEHLDIAKHNNVHIGYTVRNLYDNGKYDPIIIYCSPSWLIEKHSQEENDQYRNTALCDTLFSTLKEVFRRKK